MNTRAIFLGSKQLGLDIFKTVFKAAPSTEWIVVHPVDSNDPRSQMSSWEHTTAELGVDFKIANNSAEVLEIVSFHRPVVGLVCGWYRILDGPFLERFPLGLWGIHNSLLPKYRGGAPLVWSIINGDEEVGSTLFRIDEGMDSGPILLQVSAANSSDRNVGQILVEIQDKLLLAIPKAWRSILNGSAITREQAHERATYCSQRTQEDGLINWDNTALAIHNFVRAQTPPYPGAFTIVDEMRVQIDESRVLPHPYHGTPGQIIRRTLESVVIACGAKSALEILACSMHGESQTPGSAFPSTALRLSRLRN
jgi:methionyl-tRNA formyltransferase